MDWRRHIPPGLLPSKSEMYFETKEKWDFRKGKRLKWHREHVCGIPAPGFAQSLFFAFIPVDRGTCACWAEQSWVPPALWFSWIPQPRVSLERSSAISLQCSGSQLLQGTPA